MSDIELFKNCKIDNLTRVSSYDSVTEQNAYYTSLHAAGDGIKISGAVFNKLGLPFLVNFPFDDIIKYSYGRVKLSPAGIWYYFGIVDFEVNANGKTQIIYNIDPWETARCQLGVELGRGLVKTALPPGLNMHGKQSIEPRALRFNTTKLKNIGNTQDAVPSIFIFYRDDETNKSNIYWLKFVDLTNLYKVIIPIAKGEWATILKKDVTIVNTFAESRVVGAWIAPIDPYIGSSSFNIMSSDADYILYKMADTNLSLYNRFRKVDIDFTTTDISRTYLTDLRGNEVWQLPYGKTITKYDQSYDMSPTGLKLVLDFIELGEEGRVSIPCEPISVFTDAYTEYFVRQRESDMNMRSLDIHTAEKIGWANAASGALGGSIAGGMAGGMSTTPGGAMGGAAMAGGAIIGAVGSIVGATMTAMVERGAASESQNITDKAYEKAKDELSLIGESIGTIISGRTSCRFVTETWDEFSIERFNSKIYTYGYELNYPSPTCQAFYTPGPMSGDFEIKGDIPVGWKMAIRDRFINGVIIDGVFPQLPGANVVVDPETPAPGHEDDPVEPIPDPKPAPVGSYTIATGDIGHGGLYYKARVMFVKENDYYGDLYISHPIGERTGLQPSAGQSYNSIISLRKLNNLLGISFAVGNSQSVVGLGVLNGKTPGTNMIVDNRLNSGNIGIRTEGSSAYRNYLSSEISGKTLESIKCRVGAKFLPSTIVTEGPLPDFNFINLLPPNAPPAALVPRPNLGKYTATGDIGGMGASFMANITYQRTEPGRGFLNVRGISFTKSGQDCYVIGDTERLCTVLGVFLKGDDSLAGNGTWDAGDFLPAYVKTIGFGNMYLQPTAGGRGVLQSEMHGRKINFYDIFVQEV